jgi:hypothetical protein
MQLRRDNNFLFLSALIKNWLVSHVLNTMKNLVLQTRFFIRLAILCKIFQEKRKIPAEHFSSYMSKHNRLDLNKKESAMKFLKKSHSE